MIRLRRHQPRAKKLDKQLARFDPLIDSPTLSDIVDGIHEALAPVDCR